MNEAKLEAEVKDLRKENVELKQYIMALQGEVYGARLAAKYLDKELAGRWVSMYIAPRLNWTLVQEGIFESVLDKMSASDASRSFGIVFDGLYPILPKSNAG